MTASTHSSNQPPTEPGWYWARGGTIRDRWQAVEVYDRGGRFYISWGGWAFDLPVGDVDVWGPKIEPPGSDPWEDMAQRELAGEGG